MPTYDFNCPVCNAPKPVTQPIDEEIRTPNCDQCQVPMTRNWQTPTIIFKGSGFAINDLKGKK
jgi:putative FmdB family regulatory protein